MSRRPRYEPSEFSRKLGSRLTCARRELGFSIRKVASLISDRITITHTMLNRYEKGLNVPNAELLLVLAVVYRKPIGWFYGDDPACIKQVKKKYSHALRIGQPHPVGPIAFSEATP